MDSLESEMESLLAGKKKRLDKDKQDRMDELKLKLEKHRYHIRKLETLLRMLDNMSVEVNTVSIYSSVSAIRNEVCSVINLIHTRFSTKLDRLRG